MVLRLAAEHYEAVRAVTALVLIPALALRTLFPTGSVLLLPQDMARHK